MAKPAGGPSLSAVTGTSTLSPSLVNEARFGVNYSSEFATSPWDNLDDANIMAKAREFILFGGNNATNSKPYPILFNPGTNWNGYMFQLPVSFRGIWAITVLCGITRYLAPGAVFAATADGGFPMRPAQGIGVFHRGL